MSEETLLEFPCHFPIKAMGKADVEFDLLVLELIQQHAHLPEKTKMKSRPSKNGKYLAVTVHVEVHSKEQLDTMYRQLTSHPLVLVAL